MQMRLNRPKNENKSAQSRITNLGRYLRQSSLDELPELFNVLKGDMSFVGPRPLRVEYLPLYTKQQMKRHDVKPGITGLAQINGRNLISWEDKFKFDLMYVKKNNLLIDISILLKTVVQVISVNGINSGDGKLVDMFQGSSIKNDTR